MMENQVNAPIVVREATLQDFNECCRLAIEAVEENALMKPDPEKLIGVIYSSLVKDHGIAGVIGQVGGKLQGGILLSIGSLWYTSELVIEEKVLFVDREFRNAKGGRAKKLVEWAKKVSDELDLPLEIGVLSSERTEGKVRLYERELGKMAGAFFVWNGKTGNVHQ